MAIVGLRSGLKKSSPVKAWQFLTQPAFWKTAATVGTAVLPGVIQGIGGLTARKKAKRNQAKAKADLEQARAEFMGIEYNNPYEDLKNPYAENIYEDLTVDKTAADYATRQSQQQQANIMQGLQGAAGSSGIAGLAQSMANIGDQQAARTAASLAEQEQTNRALALKGEQQKRQGAYEVDMLQRKGEMYKKQQEDQRKELMFGLALDEEEAADLAMTTATGQVQKGVSSVATGLTGLYGVGGEFEGKLGEHLGGFGQSMAGIFGGKKAKTTGASRFDVSDFGKDAFGPTYNIGDPSKQPLGNIDLGVNLSGTESFTPGYGSDLVRDPVTGQLRRKFPWE